MLGIQQKITGFCDVIPPGINSITSFIVNLPLIILWLITLPPRAFLCILASIIQIPFLGLLVNIFPPLTLFCSFCPGSNYSCFENCPSCTQSGECVTVPQFYIDLCRKTLPYFSIFNEIFCLIGYILIIMSIPLITLVNVMLVPTGKQLCVNVNPNNCIPYGD